MEITLFVIRHTISKKDKVPALGKIAEMKSEKFAKHLDKNILWFVKLFKRSICKILTTS